MLKEKLVRFASISLIAVLFFGCNQGPTPNPIENAPPSDIVQLASSYKGLSRITEQPVFVNSEVAQLCIGASHSMVQGLRETHGPHAHTEVVIYMNDLAQTAFRDADWPYPEGAVVIKEKTALPYRHENGTRGAREDDGVGGMIKRTAGYDPSNGDWEYFYFTTPDDIQAGRMANCSQCHSAAKETDFVYGSWTSRQQR